MAKRKKGNFSEAKSKRDTVKSINPFEVHINRQKFNVLNRELKEERGLPGVSRARAIKKRKATLLQEYKVLNKSNKFYDRRIGERNSAMTKEDRVIARFSAERMKSHKRKEMFNLADDEVLTHKGQSIADIEKFDDHFSDDEGDAKGLDAKFVEEANFGGGFLTESKTNRQSIIEQLINESKKRKAERQLAKERTLHQTEELDKEWKELIPIVNMGKNDDEIGKKDSYDIIMNDLKFEPRGTPSNKLKTETEIAEEEAQKLKELEEERLRRMRGEEPNDTKPKRQHRSADDLDDGFEIEEDNFVLTYDRDGNAINFDKFKDQKTNDSDKSEGSEAENEGSDEEEENESGEEGDEEREDQNEAAEREEVNNENAEENGDDSDGESDDFSDLQVKPETEVNENDSEDENVVVSTIPQSDKVKDDTKIETESSKKAPLADESEDPSSTVVDKSDKQKKDKKKVSFGEDVVIMEVLTELKTPEEIEQEKEKRIKEMEKARKELPYAFEAPNTYEELQELLKEKSLDQQLVIIERMIKCNHPSLNQKNKEKMENLFAILMQHLNDAEGTVSWALLDRLAPYLFDLTQFSPSNAAYCVSEVILEKHSDYQKKKHKYPSLETFLFLKLIPLLFPTSDKRHCVATPAFVFMSEMLRHCQVTSRRAIASGLFLVTLFTEYIWLSKRIMPEVLNFLCGVIHLATPSTNLRIIPPFKKEHKFLFLHKSYADKNDINLNMEGTDLEQKPGLKIDDTFRIKCIYCTLKLLELLARAYETLPACKLLFESIKKHLEILEINKYPVAVQNAHSQLMRALEDIMNKKLEPIIIEAQKPKALRLYEPSIKPVYDMKKRNLPPEQAEHSKLLHKYRKEMKGALREVRRDRAFISKIKFKERAASDAERKRKVKEIYSWGAQQESEYKKMKRSKK